MPKVVSGSKDLPQSDKRVVGVKPRLLREPMKQGKTPVVYFVQTPHSGIAALEEQFIKRTGSYHRLYSFWDITKGIDSATKAITRSLDLGCRVFLDSGAFAFQGRWLKPTHGKIRRYDLLDPAVEARVKFQKAYIKYCIKYGGRFDCYANFDWRRQSPLVYGIQKELEGEGIHPLPTVHGDDGVEWFKKYIDEGYKFIAVGRGGRRDRNRSMMYLDRIFNTREKTGKNVHLHGFAITDFELMLRFPWYSVDSSTWIRAGATGSIFVVHDSALQMIHVSNRQSEYGGAKNHEFKWIKDLVESQNFDFDKMRYWGEDKVAKRLAWIERLTYNMWSVSHFRELGLRSTGGNKWGSLLGKH